MHQKFERFEEWRQLSQFPGFSISSWGNVYKHTGRRPGRLKPQITKFGYRSVKLRGRDFAFTRIAPLVAIAFYGDRPLGRIVNQIDGRKANDAIWNLEFVTPSQDKLHAYSLGLRTDRGEGNLHAKLTTKEVLTIRESSASGVDLAHRFSVSPATISLIRNRHNWKHL